MRRESKRRALSRTGSKVKWRASVARSGSRAIGKTIDEGIPGSFHNNIHNIQAIDFKICNTSHGRPNSSFPCPWIEDQTHQCQMCRLHTISTLYLCDPEDLSCLLICDIHHDDWCIIAYRFRRRDDSEWTREFGIFLEERAEEGEVHG